jgi:hypothetical protein
MAPDGKILDIKLDTSGKTVRQIIESGSDNGPALRIAQVAPLWTRVPPATYGGAELMVHWLTETLVAMGHEVTLFASADSQTSANLVSVCDENLIGLMEKKLAYNYEYYVIENTIEAMKRAEEFDVIHCHAGAAMIAITSSCPVPVVHTVHAGLDSPDEHWLLDRYPRATVAAISHSQVSTVSSGRRASIPVVYHGCDLQQYRPCFEAGEYLGFIGRMSDYKNPATAIEVAGELAQPLVLAGTAIAQDRFHAEGQHNAVSDPVGRAFRPGYDRGHGLRHTGCCPEARLGARGNRSRRYRVFHRRSRRITGASVTGPTAGSKTDQAAGRRAIFARTHVDRLS